MNNKGNINFKLFTSRFSLVLIFVVFFSVIGASYAYFFASSFGGENNISGDLATVNLELVITRVLPVNNNYMVPQVSTTSALVNAMNSSCVDSNRNIVCQVYSINVKNNGGSATVVADGKVSFYSNSSLTENSYIKMPSLRWKIVDYSNNTYSISDNTKNIASSTALNFFSNVSFDENQDRTYYMLIWFEEYGGDQIDKGNSFFGKIDVISSNGTGVTATF